MSVFGKYSQYYDLLYKDKDYAAETNYIGSLIQKFHPATTSLIELGCGSGAHAEFLAKQGYSVHGVDLSEDMLTAAEQRRSELPAELANKLNFAQGDIRNVNLNRKVDCVLSLFHVISYLPTTPDLQAAFQTARAHLDSGGLFIFDIWYAPAVLTDRPVVRVKRMENPEIQVTRIAEPVWHPNESWVDVNYSVFIRDRSSDTVEELEETHRMHYLTMGEIEMLSSQANFSIEHRAEWLTDEAPSENSWGVCFVLKAK